MKVDLTKSRNAVKKEYDMVIKYSNRFIDIEPALWKSYNNKINNFEKSEATNKLFNSDLENEKDKSEYLKATLASGATSTRSDTLGTYKILEYSYSNDKPFLNEIECYKTDLNFWYNVKTIKGIMNDISKASGDTFYESLKNFIAESKDKHKRLMDLRQAIFDNFLNTIIPDQSLFSNCEWFKSAQPKTIQKSFWYCQTKFFIQNTIEDDKLPKTTLNEINNKSEKMFNLYGELSDKGHNKTDDFIAEDIMVETVYTFLAVLQLHLDDF
jgi:hypothetical protein